MVKRKKLKPAKVLFLGDMVTGLFENQKEEGNYVSVCYRKGIFSHNKYWRHNIPKEKVFVTNQTDDTGRITRQWWLIEDSALHVGDGFSLLTKVQHEKLRQQSELIRHLQNRIVELREKLIDTEGEDKFKKKEIRKSKHEGELRQNYAINVGSIFDQLSKKGGGY